MKHTDFALKILEVMKDRLGSITYEQELREIFGATHKCDLRADLAIDIVRMVAPRYNCDITQSLPHHDFDELARQFAAIFISFGRAHARRCLMCDINRAAAMVLNRFVNTYVMKHVFGSIPDNLPYRDQFFFLDEESNYTEPDSSDHGFTGEKLRKAVRQWNITGNN